MKKSQVLFALALAWLLGIDSTIASDCDDAFSKSGSPFSGTTYNSQVTVGDLSTPDALGQMRGILIAEKMDVITEDVEGGTKRADNHWQG